jgi:hypothetical protein
MPITVPPLHPRAPEHMSSHCRDFGRGEVLCRGATCRMERPSSGGSQASFTGHLFARVHAVAQALCRRCGTRD